MKKIIIVGGGIAGICAGIYGRKAGYEVTIYEKNSMAGGECMGWNRKGHHIDNCIHWLTGTKKGSSLRNLWEEVGALSSNSAFVENKSFYTTRKADKQITLWKDLERTKKEMLLLAPEDHEEIEAFFLHVEYAMSCEMPVEKPMEQLNPLDYLKLGLKMKNMPKVIKEYGTISLEDLSNRFQNPVLKAAFTDYMPKEYIASSFIISYATIASGNGELPKGGSLSMANRMIKTFEDLGGTICLKAPVSEICVKNGRVSGVRLEGGEKIAADYVIAAMDSYTLFRGLLPEEYRQKEFEVCYHNEKNYPLVSGFQVAFSVDAAYSLKEETLIFDCAPFSIAEKEVDRISVRSYAYEPSFAPAGKFVLQTNVSQYDDDFHYWESLTKEEYTKEKERISLALKKRIEAQFLIPFDQISVLDCWTPLTYLRYCNAYHGSYMSFITKKEVPSFCHKGTFDTLPNLFLAGQWLEAPGGLPVAAATGKFAIQRLQKAEKKRT
ncbi:MAG: hypothetical protein PWP24_2000 [Clostridiales bacterium]|nr:hypothetical protein [Clostridiales bacterium]